MKAGAYSSSRRNGPLPLCPNRTQPSVLHFISSAQQVGDAWIFHSQVSVVNLQCPRSLRPFSVGCAGFRTRPRLSVGGEVPRGRDLRAAGAGVGRLEQAQTRGVSSLWGRRGRPLRHWSIDRGWKGLPLRNGVSEN